MVAEMCTICKATTEETGVKLFDAPKDAKRRHVWSASCGYQIDKSSVVCQKHFNDLDFYGRGNRKSKLKLDAVPSKNIKKEDLNIRNSSKIKAEPEFVLVNETNEESASNEISAVVNVKEEPIDCQSLSLINEECFDVNPDDPIRTLEDDNRNASTNIIKTLTCGRIVMETVSDGSQTFRIICDHCQNSFATTNADFWSSFVKHVSEAHIPVPLPKVDDGSKKPISEKNIEIPPLTERVDKNVSENNIRIETERHEIEDDSISYTEDEYNNMEDFKNSESEDETFEPKAKKRKKTKTNADNSKLKVTPLKQEKILSFDHPDKNCIITFLELLTTRAILWLPRQSIMKRFDEALTELTDKFNEFFPQYLMTKDAIRQSISRIKDLYHCMSDADLKKRRSKQSITKIEYPEYFELCAEIEENSKSILQTCDVCKLTFYSPQDLQVHKYKKHGIGELPYKCPRCCYGFACPEKLASHEAKHNRSKNFKCEICGQGFYFESKLQAHLTLHTDDSKQVCETCGKKFPSLSKYRRHKLHHEPPKEKCEICGKLYFEKWTLSEHMKSHRNERQYKCDICGKTFNRQEGVTIHKRGVHKIKTQTKKYVWVNRVTNTMATSSVESTTSTTQNIFDISMNQNEDNNSNEEVGGDGSGDYNRNIQNPHSNSSPFSSQTGNEETISSDIKPIIPNSANQQQMFPLEIFNSLLN